MSVDSTSFSEHDLPGKPAKPDLGLPKSNRLLKRAQFQEVMASGRKAVTPCLVLMVIPTQATSSASSSGRRASRLGIIASKKVGNAVMRNRAKRRIRESYRQLDPKIDGFDIVVIVRRQAAVFEASAVHYHLSRALAKVTRPPKPRQQAAKSNNKTHGTQNKNKNKSKKS